MGPIEESWQNYERQRRCLNTLLGLMVLALLPLPAILIYTALASTVHGHVVTLHSRPKNVTVVICILLWILGVPGNLTLTRSILVIEGWIYSRQASANDLLCPRYDAHSCVKRLSALLTISPLSAMQFELATHSGFAVTTTLPTASHHLRYAMRMKQRGQKPWP